jgi:hypothetical protein
LAKITSAEVPAPRSLAMIATLPTNPQTLKSGSSEGIMATQRYSVTPHPISTLLTWVKSGEIAIPEIQRPFVWEATKVRNLLDSLYQGYPVGYLIAWRNPTVRDL